MKTSAPRTDEANRQWISPLANSRRLGSVSSTPRCEAISSARAGCARPVTSTSRLMGTISIGSNASRVTACSSLRAVA